MLAPIRRQADLMIDTSALSSADCKAYLVSLFSGGEGGDSMVISVGSFGFKYGIPAESDMVLDVAF